MFSNKCNFCLKKFFLVLSIMLVLISFSLAPSFFYHPAIATAAVSTGQSPVDPTSITAMNVLQEH